MEGVERVLADQILDIAWHSMAQPGMPGKSPRPLGDITNDKFESSDAAKVENANANGKNAKPPNTKKRKKKTSRKKKKKAKKTWNGHDYRSRVTADTATAALRKHTTIAEDPHAVEPSFPPGNRNAFHTPSSANVHTVPVQRIDRIVGDGARRATIRSSVSVPSLRAVGVTGASVGLLGRTEVDTSRRTNVENGVSV